MSARNPKAASMRRSAALPFIVSTSSETSCQCGIGHGKESKKKGASENLRNEHCNRLRQHGTFAPPFPDVKNVSVASSVSCVAVGMRLLPFPGAAHDAL